ncbi:hypothetical protein F751_3461 [Auxenochlorella protothecoides]|uniref:Uncharacterized protein n=1 Tax=Auxenochlorella protothecoides TaxID=3075 RepID=A0A087SC16_AUXPR|nr:hypothetical protein F751_3461 [Auxenochlorella protothecoides]KFM23270.1 hypothetical protein F751_3461 [Auxenochlorella protothecoides]
MFQCEKERVASRAAEDKPHDSRHQYRGPLPHTHTKPCAPSAEGQRAKVAVDGGQEGLGAGQAQGYVAHLEVLHVVADLQVLAHVALARGAKGLDGEELALLHASGLAALNDGHALAAVDAVGRDAVPVQVAHRANGEGAAVQLHLVRLHDLLHLRADVAEPDVHARGADAGVGGRAHRVEQRRVTRVVRHGEGAVDDAAVDLRAKVHLHHVVVSQHRLVPGVGGVVRRHMVQGAAGGEGDARRQAPLLDHQPHWGSIGVEEGVGG